MKTQTWSEVGGWALILDQFLVLWRKFPFLFNWTSPDQMFIRTLKVSQTLFLSVKKKPWNPKRCQSSSFCLTVLEEDSSGKVSWSGVLFLDIYSSLLKDPEKGLLFTNQNKKVSENSTVHLSSSSLFNLFLSSRSKYKDLKKLVSVLHLSSFSLFLLNPPGHFLPFLKMFRTNTDWTGPPGVLLYIWCLFNLQRLKGFTGFLQLTWDGAAVCWLAVCDVQVRLSEEREREFTCRWAGLARPHLNRKDREELQRERQLPPL